MWSWNQQIWILFHYFPCVFSIIVNSWFSTKSTACGLLQIHLNLIFLKYQKTSVKQSEMQQSDPPSELPQTQNRWNSIRPEQKINILNFCEITSQAGRQPAQFAQLAPERAGLQGEHYFHELDAQDACSVFLLTAKGPKQREKSEGHFFAWSNGFSMILLAHVVLEPTNFNTLPLFCLRFFNVF